MLATRWLRPASLRSVRELSRRFAVRARLLGRWLWRTVLPEYWKPLTGAMVLMSLGTLSEAASFLVAAKFLIHGASMQGQYPAIGNHPLLLGGGALVVLLIAGAYLGYIGYHIAVKTVLDFEMSAFARATGMIREMESRGESLNPVQSKELAGVAPRIMGRTILQCVGLGTSVMLTVVGAAVCARTFPTLSLILAAIILISSPIFIYSTMKATNVGHRLRETAPQHSEARKQLAAKWATVESFEHGSMKEDLITRADFLGFYDAFRDRLMISPLSRLLVNGTLSVCIVASLMWMTATLELNTEAISRLVIFLVFLRVFFSGAKAIVTAVQMIASFVPYFFIYLQYDPRVNPEAAAARAAGMQASRSPDGLQSWDDDL